ncbi:chromate transporter [Ottowia thiooxydans]|uniref:chromate transporter n=1 Tax=Ottowia thiooxydans TaxID=219182 RepID=UPI00041B4AAA|nr:chromate transporter [Ottowia thiooxydans]
MPPIASNTAETPEALNSPSSRTDLFWSFTWLALQGFGGVLAVVQRELVEKKRWLTREQFLEDWAVAQVMPGPNVINMGMMVGDRHFGLSGALVALVGLLLFPTFVVLTLAVLFATVADNEMAQRALRGMGAVAAGLIIATGIKLASALSKSPMGIPVCIAVVVLTFIASALMRWPMGWVLFTIGGASCLWAWYRLGRLPGSPPSPSVETTSAALTDADSGHAPKL